MRAFHDAGIGSDYRPEPARSHPLAASAVLVDLVPRMSEPTVTFDWLIAALGERSAALVLVLLGLVGTLPGASAPVGILIACLAGQLLFGRSTAALPRFLGSRPIRRGRLLSALKITIPSLRYFERFSRRRFWPFDGAARRAVGAAILLMDVFLFLPIPFSNLVPAIVIALLALAYLEDDGILLGLGLTGTLVMLTVAPALMWQAVQFAL